MRSLVKKEMIIACNKQVLLQGERLKERKTRTDRWQQGAVEEALLVSVSHV